MPNISIEELQKTLQKSGLPFGSSFQMGQAKPGARQAIAGQMGDYGIPNKKNKVLEQLAQIAQMDQKLAGVYSDPTSNMYIENPVARDQATNIHRGTGFNDIQNTGEEINALEKQKEQDISEAESTYNDLTTAQKALEAEEKRQETATKKKKTESDKKARIVPAKDGREAFELSKQQARQARNAKVDLKDAKAVSEFFNRSTPEFRKFLEDEGIDGKLKGSMTAKTIKDTRTKWEKEKQKQSVKKSNETAALKKETKTKTGKKSLF